MPILTNCNVHNNIILQTRALQSAYPTHTLHLCYICGVVRKLQCMSDDPYQATCVHEQKTWPAVGKVNGHGYDGQQLHTICDSVKRFEAFWVSFSPLQLVHYAYNLLRCLDVEI